MKIVSSTENTIVIKNNPFYQITVTVVLLIIGFFVVFFVGEWQQGIRLIVGGILIIVSILNLLFTKFKKMTLDKTNDFFTLNFVSILGKKIQQFKISDMEHIEVNESTYTEASTDASGHNQGMQTRTQFTSIVIFKDGSKVLLSQESPSPIRVSGMGLLFGKSQDAIVGKKIADFAGIPFVENNAPTFSDAIYGATTGLLNPKSFTDNQEAQEAKQENDMDIIQKTSQEPLSTTLDENDDNTDQPPLR